MRVLKQETDAIEPITLFGELVMCLEACSDIANPKAAKRGLEIAQILQMGIVQFECLKQENAMICECLKQENAMLCECIKQLHPQGVIEKEGK